MPEGPYVPERQTEYWTSRQIEEHYLNAGFQLLVFPLTQLSERHLPADFILFDKHRAKVVGLQYKALYHNGNDHWRLTAHQHQQMRERFPWIYYSASELRSIRDHRNALHYARFFRPDFAFEEKLPLAREPLYYRWGAFYQALEQCKVGVRVSSREHFQELLWPFTDRNSPRELAELPDVFLSDFDGRNAVHFSPLLRRDQEG